MARKHILGRSGTGKSWYLGWYIEQVLPEFEYGFHFDVENEEAGLCENPYSYLKNFPVDKEILDDWPIPAVLEANKKVRVVPDGLTKNERIKLFEIVADTALKICENNDVNLHISGDEAHLYLGRHNIEERSSRLLTAGRKKGLEWCFATQRGQNLNEEVLGQSNWGIYFQLRDRDKTKIKGAVDFPIHRIDELQTREAIRENFDSGDVTKIDTETLSRETTHHAGDDGVADKILQRGK